MVEYRCKICDKKYASQQSLCNHNKKFHSLSVPQFTSISPQFSSISPQFSSNSLNLPQNSLFDITNESKLKCEYCSKSYSRKDNLIRHYKLCKIKENHIKMNLEKDSIIIELKKEIDNMKKLLLEKMNKDCKVHYKYVNKINNQLNNNINNQHNNVYNIIALGFENLENRFTKNEKKLILNHRYNCLNKMVEYVHFNDKYPEFKNILITNTQNNIAYKYNKDNNKFIAIDKNELLDDLICERVSDITGFYEELKNELQDKTRKIIEDFIDKIDNDIYKEEKKKDIKLIIYNNRDKVSKEIIQNLAVII